MVVTVAVASPTAVADAPAQIGWRKLDGAGSAGDRIWASAAYLPATRQVVMFGGNTCCGGTDDTFVFDGERWSELDLEVRPPIRATSELVHDAARRELVLFGGLCDCAAEFYNDTWVFDGTAWTELFPAQSPPPLGESAMAYDPVREEVVLFGGWNRDNGVLAETWVWDGATWEERHPAKSPPARRMSEMAYSKQHAGMVLFGGVNHSLEELGDTWVWDGTTWRRDRDVEAPAPRRGVNIASFGRRVVLFGGSARSLDFDDTWIYGAGGWRERAHTRGPSARGKSAVATEGHRRSVLLYGGYGDDPLGDTWRLRLR
jgi:hypothetical protein